jgi:hypothetical protein
MADFHGRALRLESSGLGENGLSVLGGAVVSQSQEVTSTDFTDGSSSDHSWHGMPALSVDIDKGVSLPQLRLNSLIPTFQQGQMTMTAVTGEQTTTPMAGFRGQPSATSEAVLRNRRPNVNGSTKARRRRARARHDALEQELEAQSDHQLFAAVDVA